MGRKKTKNVGFLTVVAIAAVFVVAAVMFTLTQYEVNALIKWVSFGGFKITFGDDNSDGKLYFGLIFLFSVLAAAAAFLSAFKILKVKPFVLFAVCGILAIGAVVVYLKFYFEITGSLKNDNLGIDLNSLVKWSFAFWFGFALQIVAFAGSVFGIVKLKK